MKNKAIAGDRIKLLFERCEYKKVIALLDELIKDYPNDHFLYTCLSSAYYELRNYKAALKYSKIAFKLEPNCPLVLWDYAGALDMLNMGKDAIKVWTKIVNTNLETLAYGECSEGLRWAKSLQNDSRYRIALSLDDLGKHKESAKQIEDHLKYRIRGIPSLYLKKDVLKKRTQILSK